MHYFAYFFANSHHLALQLVVPVFVRELQALQYTNQNDTKTSQLELSHMCDDNNIDLGIKFTVEENFIFEFDSQNLIINHNSEADTQLLDNARYHC